jgi:uncharacterized repeat protein (TIGR03803 family)
MTTMRRCQRWVRNLCVRGARRSLSVVATLLPMFVIALISLADLPAQAQAISLLYSFTDKGDGATPTGLIRDPAGNFYGTATDGGDTACNTLGCGVVFKIDTTGSETTLYTFTGPGGAFPDVGLVRDRYGNLYGTTYSGGLYNHGVIFKLDNAGNETVLYSFTEVSGASQLVLDKFGNLYGAANGGSTACVPAGCGVIFELDTSGNETTLYSFTGGVDGGVPLGVTLGPNGNLYGAAQQGGTGICGPTGHSGCGVVFKLDASGHETVIHNFAYGTEGANPNSLLTLDAQGNLYGTALRQGNSCMKTNCGVVFKLSPQGKETVLHTFLGYPTDGAYPRSPLVLDSDGNIYGTTSQGGPGYYGTVFEIDSTGTETLLYSFTAESSNGQYPSGNILLDSAGNIYGATIGGGAHMAGEIYKITP